MSNNTVRVLIAGQSANTIEFVPGETLGDFRSRVNSPTIPLMRVSTFHMDGNPMLMSYVLKAGDLFGGALEAKGG